MEKFPIYKYDYIYNKYKGKIKENYELKYSKLELDYPCRLDAMAINPAAVCYNDDMIFTPGEVVVSTKIYIKVKIRKIEGENKLVITNSTKRKVLIKHAYHLIQDVLKFTDSFEIDVNDDGIPKHCGFGSSSSTLAAVASSLNEMYGCPIPNKDLIKYLASNHGEEVNDSDEENLKMVQCIGGGATNGLTKEGILLIAGQATCIAKMNYEGDIVIGIPKDFEVKDTDFLMEEEEKNLWKFKETGEKYSKEIAYNLLHKALPDMANGSIKELAKVVYDYRFYMGSIENCSFVYENMIYQKEELKELYENNNCDFLALSSVGPAYFAIVKNKKQLEVCKKKMEDLNMNVILTKVNNEMYKVIKCENEIFWNKKNTRLEFENMKPSKYITDEIDKFDKNTQVLDLGCGGGRYSRYLKLNGFIPTAMDKYQNMSTSLEKDNIKFICGTMDNIPFNDSSFDNILSIGVFHNATSIKEFEKAVSEMYRVLKEKGKIVFSVFTNDVISDDLTYVNNHLYEINDRQPMILFSKDEINEILKKYNFTILKIVDEHITNVESGLRNVYTLLLQK